MSENSIRVMSHNVWCVTLANRKELLQDTFLRMKPDILCLQEVTYILYDAGLLTPLLDEYELLHHKVDGYVNNTPLLYKKDRFELVESGWHLFDGKNNADTKSLTWAVLKDKTNGEYVGAVSAHFWWEANGIEDDMARKYHAEQTLGFVNYIRHKYKAAVVLGGDFNCKIGSPAYNHLISEGGMDARLAAENERDMINTWHDFPVLDETERIYKTTFEPKGSHLEAIDHLIIFGKEKLSVDCFRVMREGDVLMSSDHCPIYFDAEYKD